MRYQEVNLIKRILLIQPPYTIMKHEPKGSQPPLGLAYIAAVLEKNYDVKILDCIAEGFSTELQADRTITYGLSWEDIAERIKDYSPDLLGVSCLFTTQANNAHRICGIAKNVNPGIVTVMGGAHPSAMPESTMRDENVDFVVIGEGDFALPKIIEGINGARGFEEVDGLAWRSGNETKINPKTQYIQDLDSLPFPARHLLPMEKYFSINRPHGTISLRSPNTSLITSRGCPAKCVFCSIHGIWGRQFRSRSAGNVLSEINHLIREYGVRELQFEDDNLTLDSKRAREIFQKMIDEDLGIVWTTPNGIAAYALNNEMLELMKRSGCYRICLAIESGSKDVLNKIIHKPLRLSTVKPLIQKAKELGITVDAFFVVGFPGETKDQMGETFKFANSIGAENVNFFIATPYPGTELYEICRQNGYLTENFSLDGLRVGQSSICTPDFTPGQIEKMVAFEYLKFRLRQLKRPSVFYERVVKRLLMDPRFFINYGKKLLSKLLGSSYSLEKH